MADGSTMDHKCVKRGTGKAAYYVITWRQVTNAYTGPLGMTKRFCRQQKVTTEGNARKFCARWGIEFPEGDDNG